jgi:flavodoxin
MKILVISYSLTGNNQKVATKLTNDLNADHIQITEPTKRKILRTALDVLFNRTPKIEPAELQVDDVDLVIFVAPIWMGKVAFPLRRCFKQVKNQLDRYIFISISGGAMGPNPKVPKELTKRLGTEPLLVIDKQIVELLPKDPADITREDTSEYCLNPREVEQISQEILERIHEHIEI